MKTTDKNFFMLIDNIRNHQMFRLMKNSFIYGIGDIIQRFLAVFLLPIYTRYLKPEDYGITSLLGILGMLLGTITMCGLTNGIGNYFFYTEKEKASLSEVIWSPFIFIGLFSALILIPLGFIPGAISTLLFGTNKYAYLVILTLASIFIANLSSVGRSILVFQQKPKIVNIINITGVFINVAIGLFMVVYLGRGVTGVIEAGLISSVLMSVPILMITIFNYKPEFSFSMLSKQLKFSLPLVIAVFAFWFIDSSDRYMLKMFLPLSEVGLYNIGYSFGQIIMIVVGGFTLAWPSYYHSHNQNGEGQRICNGVLKVYLLITSICVVGLSVLSPLAMKVLTTEKYHQAFTIVPWISLAYMLKGPYIIFLMGVLVKNKTTWQLYLEIFAAVLNIIGNFLLIPVIGREAAALTTLLSYGVMCIGAYWMVMRINPISQLSLAFIKKIIILTISAAAGVILFHHQGWNYFLSSALLLLMYSGLFIMICLREFKNYMPMKAGS